MRVVTADPWFGLQPYSPSMVRSLVRLAEEEPEAAGLIEAATAPSTSSFPVLPALSTEIRRQVGNEISESDEIRQAYELLAWRGGGGREADWSQGVTQLEREQAVWCLQACLCHPNENLQILALLSLERLGDTQAVPFLIYADYMAVGEVGSQNATSHGIIQETIANTLSRLTGVEVELEGQDPEGLKQGIRQWRAWQVEQENEDG